MTNMKISCTNHEYLNDNQEMAIKTLIPAVVFCINSYNIKLYMISFPTGYFVILLPVH